MRPLTLPSPPGASDFGLYKTWGRGLGEGASRRYQDNYKTLNNDDPDFFYLTGVRIFAVGYRSFAE